MTRLPCRFARVQSLGVCAAAKMFGRVLRSNSFARSTSNASQASQNYSAFNRLSLARLRYTALPAAFLARSRVDPAAGFGGLPHRGKPGAVASLASKLDELLGSHASVDFSEFGTRSVRGSGSGRSIILDARVGVPALTSYLSAKPSKRFLVKGSALSARSRICRACCW